MSFCCYLVIDLFLFRNLEYLLSNGIPPYQPGGEDDYAERVFKLIATVGNKFSDIPATTEYGRDRSPKVAVLEIINMLINTSCMKAHCELLRCYQLKNKDIEENPESVEWIKKSKYLYILLGTWLAKPRTLSHHARYSIWKAMGPNFHKVDQLELPKALILFVKDLIRPQLPKIY